MRTIGLLGGFTHHSTSTYYRLINEGIAARLGAYRSARLLLHSFDYGDVREARLDGDWRPFAKQLVNAGRGLKRAGADGLFVCSNTMHRFVPRLEAQVGLPVVHIADALAQRCRADGIETVALFGTAYTMTLPFYRERLEAHGLRVLMPRADAIGELDRIILEELAAGRVLDGSRDRFVAQMALLEGEGAQAVALACTEIGMLVGPDDVSLPVLDTTVVHARAAVEWAIGG